jgi:hypothetical protein
MNCWHRWLSNDQMRGRRIRFAILLFEGVLIIVIGALLILGFVLLFIVGTSGDL